MKTVKDLQSYFFNAVPNIVYFKDNDLVYSECNELFCKHIGLQYDEIIARKTSDITKDSVLNSLVNIEKQVLISKKRQIGTFNLLIEGKTKYYRTTISPLVDNEEVIGILCNMEDHTEAKEREEELKVYSQYQDEMIRDSIQKRRESQQRYATLFDNAADAILIKEEGKYVDCNHMTVELLGCESKEDIIGKTPLYFSPKYQSDGFLSTQKMKKLEKEASLGISQHFEWLFEKQNKEEFLVDVKLTTVILNNRKLLYIVWRDVSEQKLLEKENRQHELLLVQQSKLASLGEMMGSIAHQWRQPLNVLSITMMDLESLYDSNSLSAKKFEEMNTRFETTINFMSKTIDDFRQFFLPSKKLEYFDVKKSIDDIVWMLTPKFTQEEIALTLNVSGKITLLYGLENEFKQVLINIYNNASDAIIALKKKRSKHYDGMIKTDISYKNDEIHIEISDNGEGIDTAIIEKIFDPYFTTKFESQGTGLGLYMSKMIVEKSMKGRLMVSSSNKGTTFRMTFTTKLED
jgi:PAS domain S-box-containing protein